MDIRRKFEKDIEKQQQKIAELRTQLAAEEAYLRAQNDFLKLLPKGDDSEVSMRPGSDPAKIREMLEATREPLHVGEILRRLGREDTKDTRAAIAGTLGWYVRRGEVFTRPAPNTFGLISFPASSDFELPEGFGSETSTAPAISPNDIWPALVHRVRKERALISAWVELGQLVSITDNIAVLAFPPSADLARESCARANNRAFLESVLSELAGRPLTLKVEKSDGATPRPVARRV